MGRYTSISVSREVKERLDELRRRLGAGGWDEFFEKMLEIYREWRRMVVESEVRRVLCNDHSESRASLAGWGRLLASKLGDPDKIAAALKYLKPAEGGVYVVDKELCEGGTG
jgi:hypothetical protein